VKHDIEKILRGRVEMGKGLIYNGFITIYGYFFYHVVGDDLNF